MGKELGGLGAGNTGWPVSIVLPDIESYGSGTEARGALLAELAKDYDANTPDSQVSGRNWFGRCVYESDNDVVCTFRPASLVLQLSRGRNDQRAGFRTPPPTTQEGKDSADIAV